MKCVLCGTTGCDGVTDQNGEFVCQDCWAAGEATGRTASRFVPAGLEYPFPFPASEELRRLAGFNRKK